jgi:two-component system cell cycle sensor histidine kinase/response regulator CckA
MAQPLRVLIVEDSENDTRLLLRELERAGYDVSWERVETAASMRSALKGRSWDLVVADYTMPKFSAPAALSLLQESGIDLPFIIVSGDVGEDVAVEAMRAGAHDYLLKGALKRLVPAIQRELEQAGHRRARRKAEEQYRFLFENGPHPMWVIDRETLRFLTVNDAAVEQYGYAREEFLAMRITDIRPSEEVPVLMEAIPGIAAGVDRAIWKHRKKDGSVIYVEGTTHPLTFDGRSAWLALAYDVTDRLRAEEGIKKSEQRYRSLFESMLHGFAHCEMLFENGEPRDFVLLDCNLNFEKLTGLKDAVGRRVTEFIPGIRESNPEFIQTFGRVALTGIPERFEIHIDALGVWFSISVYSPQKGQFVALFDNITERKRSEASIQKLLHAVEQAGNAIFMTDPDGTITYMNPAFERVYGFTKEETLGRTPRILKSGQYDRAYYEEFWRRLLAGESVQGEIVNKRRDGQLITVESSVSPVLDAHGGRIGFISVQDDVTGKRVLEQQFRQSQKMEAIGQLAGGIAHDFNNLLTVILGYSDLLATEAERESSLAEPIHEIRRAGERAASLTRQLLAFSRRQVLQPKVLDLNALVENVERMLHRLIGEDIELVTVFDPRLGRVRADDGQLEQVIMNLAVNSRDAMPKGGTLTIETKDVELDEAYAREHADVTPGRYVMLAVSDTGLGMSAETKSHLFEPFFTTKGKGKGTGLGLATVYGIVKQSGGYIWAYSELNRGTSFKVYLPRVEKAVDAAPTRRVPQRQTGGSETLLLVEDEQAVRALVRRILESYGYTVIEASGAAQALEAARRHEGPIHLVLTDVVMPEMGGSELAPRVAELRPDVRVLFMSGYTDDAIVRQGLIAEGGHFLQKPFTPEVLARKVRDVLDREP